MNKHSLPVLNHFPSKFKLCASKKTGHSLTVLVNEKNANLSKLLKRDQTYVLSELESELEITAVFIKMQEKKQNHTLPYFCTL